MPYSGLTSVETSDRAAMLTDEVLENMLVTLKEVWRLPDEDNGTSGNVTVALFLEQFIIPINNYAFNEEWRTFVQDVINELEDVDYYKIDMYTAHGFLLTNDMVEYYRRSYRRMKKKFKSWLKKQE